MYLSGVCTDYSAAYRCSVAPTASQMSDHAEAHEGSSGAPYAVRYAPPPPTNATVGPFRPDVFCMCLLPSAARPYVAAPLRRMMDDGHPTLRDVFHGCLTWPPRLVERVAAAVGEAGGPAGGAYTAEEMEQV